MGRNGSGKSSLVEAIAWSLYGNESSIVRAGKESVKSVAAYPNEDCSVTLEFEMEGEEYRLCRTMRGARNVLDATLTVGGKLLAKGDSAVTDMVVERLGMDHRAFFVSVFAKQKELNALSSLRAEERRRLIRRMLGIDVLDDVVVEIDRDARLIESELKALQSTLMLPDGRARRGSLEQFLATIEAKQSEIGERINELKGSVEGLEGELTEAKTRRSEAAAARDAHQRANDVLNRCKSDLSSQVRHVTDLERQLDELESKRRGAAALEKTCEEHEHLVRQRDRLDDARRRHDELASISERLASIGSELRGLEASRVSTNEALAALKDPSSRLATVEASLAEARDQQRAAGGEARGQENDAKRLRKEFDDMSDKTKEIEKLGPDSCCPTCERRMGEQHETLLKKLNGELKQKRGEREQLEEAWKETRVRLASLGQKVKVLEERRLKFLGERENEVSLRSQLGEWASRISRLNSEEANLKQKMGEIGADEFDESEYATTRQRLTAIKGDVERFQLLRGQLLRRPEVEASLVKAKEERARMEEAVRAAQTAIDSSPYLVGDLERAQEEADRATDSLLAKNRELSSKQSEMSSLESQASGTRVQLQDAVQAEERAADATRRLEEQGALSDAMKAFRLEVISRITPALSEISSELFQELTDSKYAGIELTDEYEIEVLDGGKKYPLERFSGGEADLANLCLRLAISRMIAERSGSALGFLILDEIFGSQDQVRKRNIVQAFNQLSKRFNQIILITHVEDVKDLISGAILVRERDDGTSEIEAG